MLILLFGTVCLLVFIAAFMGEVSSPYIQRLFMGSTVDLSFVVSLVEIIPGPGIICRPVQFSKHKWACIKVAKNVQQTICLPYLSKCEHFSLLKQMQRMTWSHSPAKKSWSKPWKASGETTCFTCMLNINIKQAMLWEVSWFYLIDRFAIEVTTGNKHLL